MKDLEQSVPHAAWGGVQVAYVDDGLEAIIFTADGDMRQALNNLQASQEDLLMSFSSAPAFDA